MVFFYKTIQSIMFMALRRNTYSLWVEKAWSKLFIRHPLVSTFKFLICSINWKSFCVRFNITSNIKSVLWNRFSLSFVKFGWNADVVDSISNKILCHALFNLNLLWLLYNVVLMCKYEWTIKIYQKKRTVRILRHCHSMKVKK